MRRFVTWGAGLLYVTVAWLAVGSRRALAADPDDFGFELAKDLNLPETDDPINDVVIPIVNWVLSLLGLVAVIMIIYGGYLWLTAGGDEDQVGNAQKTLRAAVMGLIIVLLAYVISFFVVNTLLTEIVP